MPPAHGIAEEFLLLFRRRQLRVAEVAVVLRRLIGLRDGVEHRLYAALLNTEQLNYETFNQYTHVF